MIDYGMPLHAQKDFLQISGYLVDIAKIATATPRVFDKGVLIEKLDIYKASGVRTQMGGQIAEYVFATQGFEGVQQLFAEAQEIGFEIVEISDCCRPITHEDKRALFDIAHGINLGVVCEVGGYDGDAEIEKIIEDGLFALGLDVEFVIVEGSELVDANGFKRELIASIRESLDIDRIIFEVPWPGLSDVSAAQIANVKRGLILEFGPDVSLGNLLPDEIIETEAIRIGIEDSRTWPV